MKFEEIVKRSKRLSEKKHKRFINNFFNLFDQTRAARALRGPYRFVLDSNILMRLEGLEKENSEQGLLATMLFFDFFENQNVILADSIITPAVFYEFNRLNNVGSLRDYWSKFKSIRSLAEDSLGCEVLFDNLDSFDTAKHYIESIHHDVEIIKSNLDELYKLNYSSKSINSWREHYRQNSLKSLLFEVLKKMDFSLDTRYFNPHHVTLFLKDHVAFRILNALNISLHESRNESVRLPLRKVVYLTKANKLMGLADIEMLSNCNVSDQFRRQQNGNYFPASIGLTIDENLYKSFVTLRQVIVSSKTANSTDNQDDNVAKFESTTVDAIRRFSTMKDRKSDLDKKLKSYLEDRIEMVGPEWFLAGYH